VTTIWQMGRAALSSSSGLAAIPRSLDRRAFDFITFAEHGLASPGSLADAFEEYGGALPVANVPCVSPLN
jgi:hypothetical protein